MFSIMKFMTGKLKFSIVKKDKPDSEYTWINIEYDSARVGKARVIIKENSLVICSITVYPEYQRRGFAKEIINIFKAEYKKLTADRVRFSAIDFWRKMGFVDNGDGCYVYPAPRL